MTTLQVTTNADDIKSVLTDPELWSRVSEPDIDSTEFEPPIGDGVTWLAVRTDDEVVGLFFLQEEGSFTATVHINILQQHRRDHAANAAYLFLQYVISETQLEKVHAQVPVIYPDVVKFTVKQGFKVEGILRHSVYTNDQMVDQFTLGITRAEIREWLEDNYKEV